MKALPQVKTELATEHRACRQFLSVAQHRQIEASMAPGVLMEWAAVALAQRLLAWTSTEERVVVVCGGGNNGGDGWALARHLATQRKVVVAALAPKSQLCRQQQQLWQQQGLPPALSHLPVLSAQDVVVDALVGLGLEQALRGSVADWVEGINASAARVISIDVPSGLEADSGLVRGPVVKAQRTLGVLAAKPGWFMNHGLDVLGQWQVLPLMEEAFDAPQWVLDSSDFSALLRPRSNASHKGDSGQVVLVGGAEGMAGALSLAALSALYGGAGKVRPLWLAPPQLCPYPELMPLSQLEQVPTLAASAALIGPGLGTEQTALACCRQALSWPLPLVIDADALNLLARDTELAQQLSHRRWPAVLTPHPLEAARLLGWEVARVNAHRLEAVQTLATQFQAVVVLKGAGSLISDGKACWVNPCSAPALATAGSGDVLAGFMSALLARYPQQPLECALAAVHTHARAGEQMSTQLCHWGALASDIAVAMRQQWNQLVRDHPSSLSLF